MKRLLFAFCLFSSLFIFGQSRRAAWESNVALNYGLKEWKMNTSFGHRTVRESQEGTSSNRFAFIEINQFITRIINPNWTASIGYKYRSLHPTKDKNSHEQRLTQQLVYIHKNQRIRLLSRLRAEQRFEEERFKHRYRYRFSADMPLSGYKMNNKEFYLVASNEFLLEVEKSDKSFDNRTSIGLGYVVSAICKLQIDFTHRMESVPTETHHIPFISTSMILKL